ncbi:MULTISPECIES: hypothetical protein [Achromobacter]|uniref:hypothetical protein n=1 Tax=Achromobacter TaxID=222 RepID=UPI0006BEF1E9|nr:MULTISPECIES: hypothetical protein [Achromobacter]MCG2596505.1 hypothetical protein [Achromobacter sp.]MCG2603808.1 hypothetical protein [Achromobacter sp.]CAB3924104.1 hypothetical protein LMG26846_05872 [Achromobacter insuavis]CUJ62187.1 Uncharacterised protein [Achromobacter sp. 2789STDY5608621]CUK18762.1 Uncharacterised protein [Achromobacter sp. 2789STDY5608615]
MKRLLPLVFSLLAWPAHAACPAPAEWARTFQQAHADFHVAPDRDEPSLFTPAFDAALRREWNYAQGEVGHLDYDPWLGAQDGEIGGKPVFETESETRGTAIVAMRYPFVLEPGGPRTPQVVHLVLKREASQCWRLDDFITPLGDSLQRLYAAREDTPQEHKPTSPPAADTHAR